MSVLKRSKMKKLDIFEIDMAFEAGFIKVYGSKPRGYFTPINKRYFVQAGEYRAIEEHGNEQKDFEHDAYDCGKRAARALKYSKRKSIRLGKILAVDFIAKRARVIGGPLEQYGTEGWKATLNVHPKERREE